LGGYSPVDEAKHLLEVAKFLGLDVAGVSFHVGSGCGDAAAYRIALEHSMRVFDEAAELGFPPLHIVDLGGGFPGEIDGHSNVNHGRSDMPTFPMLAKVIRQELAVFEERCEYQCKCFIPINYCNYSFFSDMVRVMFDLLRSLADTLSLLQL
jgi:diaminopimelate decarboxylase